MSSKQVRTIETDKLSRAGFQASPALRQRVADRVFNELLGAILRGELKPGDPVPTQRDLSVQFGVSPLVVRQAIHRLEELELVRVRQGSTTVVLDPNDAADVRLLQLQLEVAQPGDALALAGLENRSLMVLPLLLLAQRRITASELRELDEMVDALGDSPAAETMFEFTPTYFAKVASVTRNPILRHQVRWWFRVSKGFRPTATRRPPLPASLFRRMNRALQKRSGVTDVWMEVINALCDWTEAQPGHTLVAERGTKSARSKRSRS